MSDRKLLGTFYGGCTTEDKNSLNFVVGGNFATTRVSKAREALEGLIKAKKTYETPRNFKSRKGAINAVEEKEARMEEFENKLIKLVEKLSIPTPAVPTPAESTGPQPPMGQYPTGHYQITGPEGYYSHEQHEEEYLQFNAVNNWPQWKNKDAPWRDHPNFQWRDPEQPPQQQTQPIRATPEKPLNRVREQNQNQDNWSSQPNWSNSNQGGWNGQRQAGWNGYQVGQHQGPQQGNWNHSHNCQEQGY